MDDRVGSTLFWLVSLSIAAAQPLPEGAVSRIAVAPGEPAFSGSIRTAVSPDGKAVAVADESGRLELWAITGKRLKILATRSCTGAKPRWSPDGRQLYCGCPGGVAVWDVINHGEPRILSSGHRTTAAADIVVAADGTFVVAAWPTPLIVCWDTQTGREKWRSEFGGGLAVTPDSRHVVRGWFGQRFDFLDADTGTPASHLGPDLYACKPRGCDRFALSPDGRYLAVPDPWGIVLRDSRTGEERRRFGDWEGATAPLVFSGDGHWLATTGNGFDSGELQIWEADTGLRLCGRGTLDKPATSIDLAPDGRRAVSASHDGTALVWDLAPRGPGPADPWSVLGSNDGEQVYAAIWSLARDSSGPAALRAHLPPVPKLDATRLDRLIADLDAPRHATRERASRALADHGRTALSALRSAYSRRPSAESAARLERLILAIPEELTPQEVVQRRAVKAMAMSERTEARALLNEWASGAPGAVLTDAAAAVLARRGSQ